LKFIMRSPWIQRAAIGVVVKAGGLAMGQDLKELHKQPFQNEIRTTTIEPIGMPARLLPLYIWNGVSPTILLPLKVDAAPMFAGHNATSTKLKLNAAMENFSVERDPFNLRPHDEPVAPTTNSRGGELHGWNQYK